MFMLSKFSPEAQTAIENAAAEVAAADRAIEAAYAKLRRVRNATSIEIATDRLLAARVAGIGARKAKREAETAALRELDVDTLLAMKESAQSYLYEATMSDYSVDSIDRGRRDLELINAALEGRVIVA